MLVCGMTGSIGMGKSTTAGMFRRRGVPVYDADAAVHKLYGGRAVPLVEAEFPGTTKDGRVDRALLSAAVLADRGKLARLEKLVHGLVAEEERRFREAASGSGYRLAILDIPLLFETGAERRVDAAIVVTADTAVQRERVLARPGMDEAKFRAIVERQMPDGEKRRRAHFLVDTGHGLEAAERQVDTILRALAYMV
ncbi:MAG TPA: dephospho-CoA kinase [Afifellaceae bacterium]|nr:dephospho-CoA kinase [Afifellaceae bacterium]